MRVQGHEYLATNSEVLELQERRGRKQASNNTDRQTERSWQRREWAMTWAMTSALSAFVHPYATIGYITIASDKQPGMRLREG